MPTSKPTPAEPPSNDLILAAIERAICHRGRNEPAETLSSIKEHLGLPHNGWTTLQLRPKLEALQTAGLIEKSSRRRKAVWGLTTKGRKRLDAVRAEVTLPESPQHQRWSEARTAASERIAGFQDNVHGVLEEAIDLLRANRKANSATWFELGDRLHNSCRRLASATYCLREWQEPDDSTADIDDAPHRQMGRRHTPAWGP
jgi:DNA-binding PadR family transcriptional regulator